MKLKIPASATPYLARLDVLPRFVAWLLIAIAFAATLLYFFYRGPPHHMVIATGPEGSYFNRTALRYAAQLKKQGVSATIVATEGALDNLHRINGAKERVDVAFMDGGMTDEAASPDLYSLGSVAYEPLWIFYRKPLGKRTTLASLKGLRLVIGPQGSGANFLSRKLLRAAGFDVHNSTILEADVDSARKLLDTGQADAGFFMDPLETPYIRALFMQDNIAVMNMAEAEALRRVMPFLHVIEVPRSTVDLAGGRPPEDLKVVATTVVVVARRETHSALIYLLMSIIDAVHEPPTLLQRENEFPADKDVDLPLSPQAEIYYKDGKPFLQRYLPFWLASLVESLLKVMVPLFAVLIPLSNYVPRAIRWRIQQKTTRCYLRLMALEKRANTEPHENLQSEFAALAATVDRHLHDKSIPASDVYILKEHIELVRRKLASA